MKSRNLLFALSLTWFGAMLGIIVCGLLFGKRSQRIVQETKIEMRAVVHSTERRAIALSEHNESLVTPRKMTSNLNSQVTTR
jgi:hypothetical protein